MNQNLRVCLIPSLCYDVCDSTLSMHFTDEEAKIQKGKIPKDSHVAGLAELT